MISGNGVPAASECDEGVGARAFDDSQPVRDIQNLIAKLEVVNRQLSVPIRKRSTLPPGDGDEVEIG